MLYTAQIDNGQGGDTTITADSLADALGQAIEWAREGDWPDNGCEINVSVQSPTSYTLYTGKDEQLNGTQYATIEEMTTAVLQVWPAAEIDTDSAEYDTCPTSETDGEILTYSTDEGESESETVHIDSAAEKQNQTLDDEGEVLAEDEGEFKTRQVIRIGDCYFYRVNNGGSRGAWDYRTNPVVFECIEMTQREAMAKLLEFGLEPSEVAKKTRP